MKRALFFLCTAMIFFAFVATAGANDTVLAVQSELKKSGFYAGSADGIWGSQTAAAVRRYQLANDLKVTGELNEATLKSLSIVPEVPKYKALADLFKGGPYLNAPPDVQVATVRKAKENLKLLGYYIGPVDENPTPAFTAAIKEYQRSARFKASGRLDKTTLQALNLMNVPDAAY
jgi:peptidoglycan hydrolase-like protein with peptidoglycan-binding domain